MGYRYFPYLPSYPCLLPFICIFKYFIVSGLRLRYRASFTYCEIAINKVTLFLKQVLGVRPFAKLGSQRLLHQDFFCCIFSASNRVQVESILTFYNKVCDLICASTYALQQPNLRPSYLFRGDGYINTRIWQSRRSYASLV